MMRNITLQVNTHKKICLLFQNVSLSLSCAIGTRAYTQLRFNCGAFNGFIRGRDSRNKEICIRKFVCIRRRFFIEFVRRFPVLVQTCSRRPSCRLLEEYGRSPFCPSYLFSLHKKRRDLKKSRKQRLQKMTIISF